MGNFRFSCRTRRALEFVVVFVFIFHTPHFVTAALHACFASAYVPRTSTKRSEALLLLLLLQLLRRPRCSRAVSVSVFSFSAGFSATELFPAASLVQRAAPRRGLHEGCRAAELQNLMCISQTRVYFRRYVCACVRHVSIALRRRLCSVRYDKIRYLIFPSSDKRRAPPLRLLVLLIARCPQRVAVASCGRLDSLAARRDSRSARLFDSLADSSRARVCVCLPLRARVCLSSFVLLSYSDSCAFCVQFQCRIGVTDSPGPERYCEYVCLRTAIYGTVFVLAARFCNFSVLVIILSTRINFDT